MNTSFADHQNNLNALKTAILIARGREEIFQTEMDQDKMEVLAKLEAVMRTHRAPTPQVNPNCILEIARQNHWTIREVDRQKGSYFGVVVALDQFGCFVQFRTNEVIELEFNDLEAGTGKPKMGDSVRMHFKNRKLHISTRPRRQWSAAA